MLNLNVNKVNKKFYYYALFVVLIFVLYGNSLTNDYNIDDNLVTEKNTLITKGIKAIPEIFTSSYKTAGDFNYGYRPIAKSLFAIEYELFGENPFIGHLVNLLFYALSCIILFNVLIRIFRNYNKIFSLFIVLLFLFHPLHTEVVLSLKNREDILSFLACLLSLLFFIRYADTKKFKNIIIGIIFFILAYLSKESALLFAAIIPLVLYYFTDLKVLKSIFYFVVLFVSIFIIRKYISYVLPENKSVLLIENPLFAENGIIDRFPTGMTSLLYYLKLMIFPHPLRFYYGFNMIPVAGILNIQVIASIIIHLFILIVAFIGLRKKTIISFSIFFYLISISMFSNIIVAVNGIVAERLAYTATLGFCIFISYLIFKLLKIDLQTSNILNKKKQTAFLILLFFLIPFSVKTIQRVPNWENNFILVEHDIKYLENSFIANEMYATQLLFKLENPESVKQNIAVIKKHYDKCISLYPDFYRVWNNLGFIESVVYRNFDKAIIYFNKALELKPNYAEALYQLGFVYELTNDYKKSVEYYEKAIEVDSSYIEALSKLANWNNKIGNYKQAFEFNIRILIADPKSEIPFINVGNYFYFLSDFENSIKFWKIAIKQNPENYQLHINIGNYYKNKGDIANANTYYDQAQSIRGKR